MTPTVKKRRGAKNRRELTETQFNLAVGRFPRLSERAKDIAKAVLVGGASPKAISSEYGVSLQLVTDWCIKIYRAHTLRGWVTASITLPEDKMAEVKQMQIDEMARLEETTNNP